MAVSETLPADAVKPSVPERMLAEGRVILKNPSHALKAYPALWPSRDAARKDFERERTATFPYIGFVIGDCRTPLVSVSYQLAGGGQQPAQAWFHALEDLDCKAWLTEKLGPLKRYEEHPTKPS